MGAQVSFILAKRTPVQIEIAIGSIPIVQDRPGAPERPVGEQSFSRVLAIPCMMDSYYAHSVPALADHDSGKLSVRAKVARFPQLESCSSRLVMFV